MKCKLSDICSFRKGKIETKELNEKNYISTENMIPNKQGITNASSLPKVRTVNEFKKGDVLVSNIRPYFKKIWIAEYDGGCSNDILVFKANKGINNYFLYYLISDDAFFEYATVTAKGTKMPRGDKSSIMSFEVPDFDMGKQLKIASILKSIDDKIKINNKINNNLEQQAVLLFKEWFTDFVNTSSNLIETQFGLIPDTFRLLKNGELPIVVTDYVANGSFASLKANVTLYQEPNYAYFIRNTDLKSGSFKVFVDENSYRFLSKSTLYGGEIIISNVGDVGSVFLCPKLNKPMTLGNNVIMLRPEQDNLKYYLYVWFKWLYGQSLIQGIKGGSAQPKFNKTDFKNLPIFLPTDDLLEQFQQMVKPIFELIEKNNEENQALIVTRDTLLPKLISGEFDISDIEL
ncbi:restriction endonuclease subunit S [Peptoclostridium sp. AF21-18]|uniref:restriction endonuclease subunit S n=1 Tax=Peptoclostridium sp. AF21-18 TaxID=2292243 RepID=UPI000E52C31E|nr:restriction endonuclease subunit S [Peptoclostridium sp. AF21-18]RHQ98598.1 restriction endonuclease subunit S [Peptoclostridium sp. AF21-18]